MAAGILRSNPVHVLREITHLIKRVPHWKLHLVRVTAGRDFHGDFDKMPLRTSKGDDVTDRGLRKKGAAVENKGREPQSTPEEAHRGLLASTDFIVLRDSSRCGSFS